MNKLQKNSSAVKNDVMVSVRLPRSLVEELKDLQKINHFMDLSDEMRFVVRRYCLKFLNSNDDSSSLSIEMLAEQKRKEKLIDELSKIIDSLKGNSGGESK
jgi:Arc/MetJ-type ribon-helix-helix transcriptional regulator